METLLEEIALIAAASSGGSNVGVPSITPAAVDLAVANCADLWGLLQPYSHLNAGRIASGKVNEDHTTLVQRDLETININILSNWR